MRKILQLAFFFLLTAPAFATNWFVRTDGGTRYSSAVTSGQCNGQYDAAYPGSGVNQNCAYNDFRYLYDDDNGTYGWIISGGDHAIIRGCTALSTQVNPSNPNCRIGNDNPAGGGTSQWCQSNHVLFCEMPVIPAGTSGNPTMILGACAYGTYTCNPVGHSYPYTSNLTQLFCGFGLSYCFNLMTTSYVTIEGIELTTHNQHWNGSAWSGNCTRLGTPGYPVGCAAYPSPYDDYGDDGFTTSDNYHSVTPQSTNITLQDVYVHGFAYAGLYGPVGAGWSVTNVESDFNALYGWNFNDNEDSADGAAASLSLSYLWMEGNGCYEQYPIVNTQFPARVCYDDGSGGFGDSLSGQDALIASLSCNHCTIMLNTKDGWIGPHTLVTTNTIENSVWYGNMGSALKWGTANPATVLFQNNLVVGNCERFTSQIPGAVQNFASVYIASYSHPSSGVFLFQTSAQSPPLIAGESIYLREFNYAGTVLNGTYVTVLSTGLSSTQFEANISGEDSLATDLGWTSPPGAYLSDFCRATGEAFGLDTNANTTEVFYGNTVITAASTVVDIGTCGYTSADTFNYLTTCPTLSTVTWKDNLFLGYTEPGGVAAAPGLWYTTATSPALTSAYNLEYGIRNGDACGGNIICSDPLLVNEPAQTWPGAESDFDVFNPFNAGNSFEMTPSSPAKYTGTTLSGLTTDYYGATRPSPPSMGGVEYGSGPSGSYTLTVSTSGTGTGSISGSNCSTGSYTSGTTIGACTATPNGGSVFAGWTGTLGCTGTGTCTASLTGNSTMNAVFNLASSTGAATMQGIVSIQGTAVIQ
jgi:hypothetical protein